VFGRLVWFLSIALALAVGTLTFFATNAPAAVRLSQRTQPGTTSNYFIKDILPITGLVAVWGLPKCGESFWMFDV
jgi:hypothetical protein